MLLLLRIMLHFVGVLRVCNATGLSGRLSILSSLLQSVASRELLLGFVSPVCSSLVQIFGLHLVGDNLSPFSLHDTSVDSCEMGFKNAASLTENEQIAKHYYNNTLYVQQL